MSKQAQLQAQVDRVLASSILHGSESLCKLLRYLAEQAVENPGVHLKEYQIATEVLGRPPDFDPQSDSIIRVQAARLRGKLAEYYAVEGADDPVVVELPRGSYSLQFHRRVSGNGGHPATVPDSVNIAVGQSARHWRVAVAVLGLLSVGLGIIVVELLRGRSSVQASLVADSETTAAAFPTFWKPFLTGTEEPWVIFSNAVFVGRPETGIRYFDPKRDPRALAWDHYTGVGEVLAIHELDQVFSTLHRRIRVKRGSLFSLDDANNNNLIFVGSPSENLKLSDLPSTREFIFQRVTEGPRKGDLAIVSVHPQTNEARVFLASPSGTPLTEDYAIVALMPGLNPARSLMVLAGTTTFGTQAAVEFVCRRRSVEALLSQLSVSSPGDVKPFEAVVRVKIALGVPVGMELVAFRKRG